MSDTATTGGLAAPRPSPSAGETPPLDEASTFVVEPAAWAMEMFYAQAGYPPRYRNQE